MTKTQPEPEQPNRRIGDKVPKAVPETKLDAEGFTWRFHKPGFEINQHGQLRTKAK